MAKNTGDDTRKGSVDDRTQLNVDPKKGKYIKRDISSGEFIDVKKDDKPFKGVARETDKRRK